MNALNLFRAPPPAASSSRGRNVPCTAQSREYLLPAGNQLVGAVTPVPTFFIFGDVLRLFYALVFACGVSLVMVRGDEKTNQVPA